MPRSFIHCTVAAAVVGAASPAARATWSIVVGDQETKEVAVGTVTCLNNFDLLAIVPVVVVEKGAAAVQAAGDFNGTRRPIIFDHLMMGTPPEEILVILAGVSGHQSRQYGIVDTKGGAVTFTGNSTFQWAGGVIGSQGSMFYAIQGNILAGSCVVPAIEAAVLAGGDVPARLMAGMEAARVTGGDGRCSCSPNNPTSCGCPPADFTKSGHIGGMVVARVGDTDDAACNASGCVDGDYFMRLNVPFQSSNAPDPVLQLQDQFDAWRKALEGRPDAIHSTVGFDPPVIPPNGLSTTTMTIALLDWRDEPISSFISDLTVEHARDSDGLSSIGSIANRGGGIFSVTLTSGAAAGTDRFVVTVDDGIRPVVLMPDPALEYFPLGDLNGDCVVGVADLLLLLAAWGPCPPGGCLGDLNGDGVVGVGDMLILFANWGPCP